MPATRLQNALSALGDAMCEEKAAIEEMQRGSKGHHGRGLNP
jgi:hypothetical protein